MTPRQRAEMERLKGRVRILETRNQILSGGAVRKADLDRLVWLVNEIESKPADQRFVRVALSATDAKHFRRIVTGLVEPRG